MGEMWYETWLQRLLSWKPIALIIAGSRKLVLPGFQGKSLYQVTIFFYQGITKGSLTSRAASIAFNFFLAIFPAILFFFTIIPYLPVHDFKDSLLSLINDLLPEHVYLTIRSTIEDIITRQRTGLLSFGFLMALYFSTSGISSIIEAFNMTVHTTDPRPLVKQKLVSIVLVLILALLTITAIFLITVSSSVLGFLMEKHILVKGTYYYLLLAGKWIVLIALIYFGISFLYFLAPGKHMRFSFFSAGSSLATCLTLALSIGFEYYVGNFSQYNLLYGSIGTLIIILLWIYFNAIVLLIGFELNASIQEAKLKDQQENRA